MSEAKPATDERKWKAQYSEITPDHRGYYIYNPKGEMVAIIYEQDRPESDGFVYSIINGLNSIARIESDRAKIEQLKDNEQGHRVHIAGLSEQIAQLEKQIDDMENTVYCPTCGTCGIEGCCHPDRCKTVQCYYGADNMRSYKELLDENAQLEKTVKEYEGKIAILSGFPRADTIYTDDPRCDNPRVDSAQIKPPDR